MSWFERLANAVRGSARRRPRPGRLILPRREDSIRDYPSAGLTPSRLAGILREADEGSLSSAMQLYEEMEEKDPHLFAVASTRRLALLGLPWEVVSAAEATGNVDVDLSDAVAEHARDVLQSLDEFEAVLQHLSLAVGRNIAIAEIVWETTDRGLRPVALVPVDFSRIVFDELDRPRILTAEHPREGMELPPHKFIVHTPHSVSGHVQRGGLLRVTAMVYLAKNLSLKDWMIFAEIFGMPVRIARYDPGATAEEKRELLTMLEALGSQAAGLFSRAVDLQIVETNRQTTGAPYRHLIEFLNREMSKAWLGQTLTTDIAGQSGSVAASRVHEQVRQDVLADDLRKEAGTIRRDLLAPLARMRFGPEAPVPYFRRKPRQPASAKEAADMLSVAVHQLGIQVPEAWVRETLGIPPSRGGESVVSRVAR